jgi:AcrR family transcriptional regulator
VKEHRGHQHEAALDAVGAILAERGYEGVELGTVGQRVGSARTSRYRCAHHKDELVAQWLQRAFESAMAEAQAVLGGSDPAAERPRPGSMASRTSPQSPATAPPPA